LFSLDSSCVYLSYCEETDGIGLLYMKAEDVIC